jgi:hypothetical protein
MVGDSGRKDNVAAARLHNQAGNPRENTGQTVLSAG